MKNKNTTFDLYSENERINLILLKLKSQQKIYFRLLSALKLLGDFSGKVNVDLFDIIDDDKDQKIILYCNDKSDNIFLFYVASSNKKDRQLITKITNSDEIKYDVSLAKKFTLNEENIDFIKTDKEYGFKFGRLITDDKTFYSIFLGDNIGYKIEGNFDLNLTQKLLNNLNKLKKMPSLFDYTSIFEKILREECCEFTQANISAYKDFVRVRSVNLSDEFKSNYNNKLMLSKIKKM